MTETHNDVGVGMDTEEMGKFDLVLGFAFVVVYFVGGMLALAALVVAPFAFMVGSAWVSTQILGWAAPGGVVGLVGVLIWAMGVDVIGSYK